MDVAEPPEAGTTESAAPLHGIDPEPVRDASQALFQAGQGLDVNLEKELVRQASGGDHRAFTRLLHAYDRRIMMVILRFTANRFDREDLYQDVFMACYRSLPRFKNDCAFYTWLYRIALNQCISFIRRQRHFEEEQDVAIDGPGWEEKAQLNAVYQAQQSLLGPQRISFHLFYIEQWSLEEIAAVLDCSIGTVKSHLHRAREKVRGHQEVQKWNIRI